MLFCIWIAALCLTTSCVSFNSAPPSLGYCGEAYDQRCTSSRDICTPLDAIVPHSCTPFPHSCTPFPHSCTPQEENSYKTAFISTSYYELWSCPIAVHLSP